MTTTTSYPSAQPPKVTVTAKAAVITKVGLPDFNGFISDLEASPSFITKIDAANTNGPRPEETLSAKEAKTETAGMKKISFVGLFSNNCKLTGDNKLMKFAVDNGLFTLGSSDLIYVRTKF